MSGLLASIFAPQNAARGATAVDLVTLGLTIFSLLFSAAIVGLMAVFAVRYRAGSRADRTAGEVRDTRQELVWIAIPSVIGLSLFAWAAGIFLHQSRPPDDARTVYVVAKQWMWKVQHPEGRREIDELHLAVGQPVKLVMTSQDVVHSFYVPAFRTKQDVLPGRYTTLWFEPTRVGEYHLFCAEFCGTGHSDMIGRVVVREPADFARWLSAASDEAPAPGTPGVRDADLATAGAGAFHRLGCVACHLPDAAVRAPRLDGLWGRPVRLTNDDVVVADEAYVRESILDPQAKIAAGYPQPSLMPTYRGQVTEDDLRELVEFVRSLSDGWPSPPARATAADADTTAATAEETP